MNKLLFGLLAFGLVGQVYAEGLSGDAPNVRTLHHNNFISQRAYSKAPSVQPKGANEAWVGAGLVTQDPEQVEKAKRRHNQQQMNFFSKQPYSAPRIPDGLAND